LQPAGERKRGRMESIGGNRRKVGIMGGTFDPIHTGHLILGESAYEQFGLDEVLFMPSGNPPHKQNRIGGATNEQRVEMVRLAVADNPHFSLSLEEMHEMGYIYTSKTLQRLREKNPDTDYYFIMGADSLLYFDAWHEPDVISSLCTIVVAIRDHLSDSQMDEKIRQLTQMFDAKILKLETPNIDISSSQIRSWFQEKRGCRYYVPQKVRKYILSEDLYSGEAE